jgi:predicted dehydrogenase
MLRVAVLGSGFMGSTHAKAYGALDDVEIVGVSSRTTDKAGELAAAVGAEPFTDSKTLATHEDVDAVSVTLPTPLHEEYVVAALDAGKHVFVEKPMDITVAACDRMIEAAESNDRLLMVAHVLRFWPEYEKVAEVVGSGKIGSPLSATATRLSTRPAWGDWFADPEMTGGAVHDMLGHDLDAMNWLFGPARQAFAEGRKGPNGGWDHVLALTDHDGVKCLSEGSFMMPAGFPFTMSLAVLGDKGRVEFDFRAAGAGVETGTHSGTRLELFVENEDPQALDVKQGDAYAREVGYFVACVRDGRVPERGTAAQGREAVRLALAARSSLDDGRQKAF